MSKRTVLFSVVGLVLSTAAALVVLIASPWRADSDRGGSTVEPGVYSYEEARELGLINEPAGESNLPTCAAAELLPRTGPATGLGNEDLSAILSPELTARKNELTRERNRHGARYGGPALCALDPESAGVTVIVPPVTSGSQSDRL